MKMTLKMIALATILAAPASSFAKAAASGAKGAGAPHGRMDGDHGPGGPGGPGRRGGMRGMGGMMNRMAKELGLSAAQKTKLEAAMKKNGDKRRAIRENKSLSQDQKKTQMKALRTSSEAQMKAILTPAQRTKLAAMQAKMRDHMRENGGRMGGGLGR